MAKFSVVLIAVAIVTGPALAEPQNGWPSSRDRFSDHPFAHHDAQRPALATQAVTPLDRRIERQDNASERICPEC
ncbi:MAG: hypothetical protein JWL62_3848 [Hyphomicrobiales bacterium]|nr:hypothetical protein [Hyphomicrobiales bacterium]